MTTRGKRIVSGFAAVVIVGIVTVAALAGAREEPDGEASGEAAETSADSGDVGGADAGAGRAETSTDAHEGERSESSERSNRVSAKERAAGRRAFLKVAKVLKSPRCMNCHPKGDAPLQTDRSRPHQMNISRESLRNGIECATCHRNRNSEAYGVEDGPPGAPHWNLPPEETPMVFEGRTPTELCRQLQDPKRNGGKDL